MDIPAVGQPRDEPAHEDVCSMREKRPGQGPGEHHHLAGNGGRGERRKQGGTAQVVRRVRRDEREVVHRSRVSHGPHRDLTGGERGSRRLRRGVRGKEENNYFG